VDRLHNLWNWLVLHWSEIGWAALFALIVGVVLELLDFRSRLRAVIRRIKNKQSERSAAQLRKRIEQLEKERDKVSAYLSSDKALYLAMFENVIAILLCMVTAAGINTLDTIFPMSPLNLIALLFYVIAGAGAIHGFKIAELNTRAKVSKMVETLEEEILGLRKKLEAISK
jgi:hypothetical protein